MPENESLRDQFYEFIQKTQLDDDDLEGAVLVGFLIVGEWEAPDGDRWLSKLSGDASRELPAWRERMLGFEIAHHWWNDEGEEEEDASQEE